MGHGTAHSNIWGEFFILNQMLLLNISKVLNAHMVNSCVRHHQYFFLYIKCLLAYKARTECIQNRGSYIFLDLNSIFNMHNIKIHLKSSLIIIIITVTLIPFTHIKKMEEKNLPQYNDNNNHIEFDAS